MEVREIAMREVQWKSQHINKVSFGPDLEPEKQPTKKSSRKCGRYGESWGFGDVVMDHVLTTPIPARGKAWEKNRFNSEKPVQFFTDPPLSKCKILFLHDMLAACRKFGEI